MILRGALFLALLVPSVAFALPEICGNGIDDDSTGGDAACDFTFGDHTFPDEDRDGYVDSGSGEASGGPASYGFLGIDCDDGDRNMYPGIHTTTGCTGSDYKTCQADGTFTSCQSGPLCERGTCYYVDPTSGNDTTGDGSFGSPWASMANLRTVVSPDSTPSNHVSLGADTAIYIMSGTLSGKYTQDPDDDSIFYLNSVDGTSAESKNILAAYPGETVIFDPNCTSGDTCHGIFFLYSDNWQINGNDIPLEITDTYREEGGGIAVYGNSASNRGTGIDIYNVKIHGHDGNVTLSNTSGIYIAHMDDFSIHHNELYDNGNYGATLASNSTQLVIFSSQDGEILYNLMYYTDAASTGNCMKVNKHGLSGQTSSEPVNVIGNDLWNCGYSGYGAGGKYIKFYANRCVDCETPMFTKDWGADFASHKGVVYEYNTFPGTTLESIFRFGSFNEAGTLTVRKNISTFDNASSDAMRICDSGGCTDSTYTEYVTAGYIQIYENCWSNDITFDVQYFYGTSHSNNLNFTEYQAEGYGTDAHANEAITMSSDASGYHIATSSNCQDYGWNKYYTPAVGSPTPTPTPTPTPGPAPVDNTEPASANQIYLLSRELSNECSGFC